MKNCNGMVKNDAEKWILEWDKGEYKEYLFINKLLILSKTLK